MYDVHFVKSILQKNVYFYHFRQFFHIRMTDFV